MNELICAIVQDATKQYACIPEYKRTVAAFLQKYDIYMKPAYHSKKPSEGRFALCYQVKREAAELFDEFTLPFALRKDVSKRFRLFFAACKNAYYCMQGQLNYCIERIDAGFYDAQKFAAHAVKDIYCQGDIAYDRGVISEEECKRYKQFVERWFRDDESGAPSANCKGSK